MPPKVLLAAVPVLIYTLICLVSACLLLWVLWRGKESYSCTYITESNLEMTDQRQMSG